MSCAVLEHALGAAPTYVVYLPLQELVNLPKRLLALGWSMWCLRQCKCFGAALRLAFGSMCMPQGLTASATVQVAESYSPDGGSHTGPRIPVQAAAGPA